jgi:hypothetical protein
LESDRLAADERAAKAVARCLRQTNTHTKKEEKKKKKK